MTDETILSPALYPEYGAQVWCRVLSNRIVASCSGCGYAIRGGAHASYVAYGFWCRACCPACRTVPTEEDVRVMRRNAANGGESIEEALSTIRVLGVVVSSEVAPSPRRVTAKAEPKPFANEPITHRLRGIKIGTRLARAIDLLARPGGVTLDDLEKELHLANRGAVRTWLAFDMRKQIGYGYSSEDGVTVKLVMPKGMREPVTHVDRLSAQSLNDWLE